MFGVTKHVELLRGTDIFICPEGQCLASRSTLSYCDDRIYLSAPRLSVWRHEAMSYCEERIYLSAPRISVWRHEAR